MKQYIIRLTSFTSPTRFDWLVYFGAFFLFHIPGILNFYSNSGSNNAYLLFAQSLLDGKLTLPAMSSYADMVAYGNSHYLPYPPLPSIILMPFVALFGAENVNTVFIALIMSCVNLYLIHRIFIKIQLTKSYLPWFTAAFFFGSGYWYALFTSHHVYAFAHITSCMFILLFLNEILGRRRWWLIGLFIGCSFLTRQFTILYVLFAAGYMHYLHGEGVEKIKLKNVFSLLFSILIFVAIYLVYNYLRFGNTFDTGYRNINFIGVLKERVDQYGVFSFRYVFFNFYSFFLKGFNIEFEGPGLLKIKDMDLWGSSLIAASPFLIASLKAKWPKVLKTWAWISILSILTGILFYHNNGYHQINAIRFSLDFLPLLIVLAALGSDAIPKWLLKGMIMYSVLLNLIGFLIHSLYE